MNPLDEIEEYAAEMAASGVSMSAHFFERDRITESPIETAMLAALRAVVAHETYFNLLCIRREMPPPFRDGDLLVAVILPQFEVCGYRVDFALPVFDLDNGKWRDDKFLIIECDGHSFHERTKEQAARDRTMDRALQAAGHVVFRFTGSEIWRRPIECARQALEKFESLGSGVAS